MGIELSLIVHVTSSYYTNMMQIEGFFEFEWEFYALSASEAIFRARTYDCITYSVR